MSRSRRQWGEDSTVRIDLSAGASFIVAFKGNFFELTHDERELVASVTSIVQQYKNGKAPGLAKEVTIK